jgi:hypothetical protein
MAGNFGVAEPPTLKLWQPKAKPLVRQQINPEY